ncbi:choice-of-anchor Q domain-containing protein [Pseudomonas borbori]
MRSTCSAQHSLRAPMLALCMIALPTYAADFLVTSDTDQLSGVCAAVCSLRDAVQAANSLGGSNRILLPAGTHTLALLPPRGDEGEILDDDDNQNGDLDVSGHLTILGAAAGSTVDGAYIDRVFEVLPGANLTLSRLTVQRGRTYYFGGGVENHGTLTVQRVRFEGNLASGAFEPGAGGGIANFGQLNLYNSVLNGNRSSAGEAFSGRGGALFNQGTALVRDSLFSNNRASDDDETGMGGGVYNRGNADVARSAFIGNSASGSGAAITNIGVLKLSNSTLGGNDNLNAYFGGTFNNGQSYPPFSGTPEATLIHVTIAGNLGGGLHNFGKLRLRNSLISGNSGLYDETSVDNCNNAGDLAEYQAVGLLLGSGPGNCTAELTVDNQQTFTQVLEPMADNGGNSPTFTLPANSPALDASIGSCASHDQRRAPRPLDGNGDGVATCDLGAFER